MCIGSYADISVHAPTRGATSNSLSFSIFSVFQSTLPREERLLGLNFKEANSIFQSTLPREERPVSPIFDLQTSHFNPRSHERSDTPIAIPTTPAQFQSTLPREERLSNVDFKSIPYISIHAPTRGATNKYIIRAEAYKFQSTLPREERRFPFFNNP